MTGDIFWLASYPKSGNTWTRALLANYYLDDETPADINELGSAIASARKSFDDVAGLRASDLTNDEIDQLRPRLYKVMSDQHRAQRLRDPATGPKFMKVHDAQTRTEGGQLLFPKSATAGAIYVVRDPRDVAESFAHHANRSTQRTVGLMGDPTFALADDPKNLSLQLQQRLLSWSDHVRSWVDQSELPVVVVRYEDLIADAEATLRRVIEFTEGSASPERVAKAVRFSAFERMRAQEHNEGFREKAPASPTFFRQGRANGWRESLDPELAARIVRDHGEVMRRFRYLDKRD